MQKLYRGGRRTLVNLEIHNVRGPFPPLSPPKVSRLLPDMKLLPLLCGLLAAAAVQRSHAAARKNQPFAFEGSAMLIFYYAGGSSVGHSEACWHPPRDACLFVCLPPPSLPHTAAWSDARMHTPAALPPASCRVVPPHLCGPPPPAPTRAATAPPRRPAPPLCPQVPATCCSSGEPLCLV